MNITAHHHPEKPKQRYTKTVVLAQAVWDPALFSGVTLHHPTNEAQVLILLGRDRKNRNVYLNLTEAETIQLRHTLDAKLADLNGMRAKETPP